MVKVIEGVLTEAIGVHEGGVSVQSRRSVRVMKERQGMCFKCIERALGAQRQAVGNGTSICVCAFPRVRSRVSCVLFSFSFAKREGVCVTR